jgi:isoleucyl-tRNA synthetase
MPGKRDESVFFSTWYEGLFAQDERRFDQAFLTQAVAVREVVSKELEKVRVAERIGASLDAEVDLYYLAPL